MYEPNKKIRKLASFNRAVLLLIAIIGILYLFWLNLLSSGNWIVRKNFISTETNKSFLLRLFSEDNLISNFYPDSFYLNQSDIFIEPVFFNVKVPRLFPRGQATIVFRNPDQDLFQIGVKNRQTWNWQYLPLENKILDKLDWFKVSENGITLWQKEKKYLSIQEFLTHLPQSTDYLHQERGVKIATVNYHFSDLPESLRQGEEVIEWNVETNYDYVDYIIARYQPPKELDNGWKMNQVDFENPLIVSGKLEFSLSSPQLALNGHQITIRQIEIALQRPALTYDNLSTWLIDYVNKFFYRLIHFNR